MASRVSCWLHGHRWGPWDSRKWENFVRRPVARALVRPMRREGSAGDVTTLNGSQVVRPKHCGLKRAHKPHLWMAFLGAWRCDGKEAA